MFQFEDSIYLFLLISIPILFSVQIWAYFQDRKKVSRMGVPDLVYSLMPGHSVVRKFVKFVFVIAGLFMLILAFSRPTYGVHTEKKKISGFELIVAIDISNSMLAKDDGVSRLEKAKALVQRILDKMDGNKVGILLFAGEAYMQLPLTTDFLSACMFLEDISPSMITAQGTDMSKAISLADKSFSQKKALGKTLLVITDGENHESGEDGAIRSLVGKGIHLFLVGVGSESGAPIMFHGEYLKDNEGKEVTTRLNTRECKRLAKEARGEYFYLDNANVVGEKILERLQSVNIKEVSEREISARNEQYQIFAFVSFLFLFIEPFIGERKRMLTMNKSARRVLFLLCTILLWPINGHCLPESSQFEKDLFDGKDVSVSKRADEKRLVRSGNKFYRNGQYGSSLPLYEKALSVNSNSSVALYNKAAVLLRQQSLQAAMDLYEHAAANEKNTCYRAQIHHNMGVICQSAKQYDNAITFYKQALRENPGDEHARYNLALCEFLKRKSSPTQNKKEKEESEEKREQQQKDTKPQMPKEKAPSLSEENAQRLLDLSEMKERAIQKQIRKNSRAYPSKGNEKNW